MKKQHRWTLSLLLYLAVAPSWAEDVSQIRTTISVISSGKEVARIQLPIGVTGGYEVHADKLESDKDAGRVRAAGNVQLKFTPAVPLAGSSMDFIADELTVTKEVLDPEKIKAIMDLEAMRESDQRHRSMHSMDDAAWALQTPIDEANMARLAKIIERYGWPGARFAGTQGSRNAFLVLQHADLESQQKYLPLIRDAVAKKDALPSELAMLEDRVRIDRGQPQIYGTQMKDGAFAPIEDEANVDRRRAAVGLMPLEGYAKMFGIRYQKKSAAPALR